MARTLTHEVGFFALCNWPGDKVIRNLVWKSSRQFIYAATVIRYVESTRHRPDHRLDVILNRRPGNGDHPFAELDSLYAMILGSALDIDKVLHVLSLSLMPLFIYCSDIEKLLSYDEGELEILFCDMGALVQVREDYKGRLDLTFLHASFREYLLDSARSKQFHIDLDIEIIKHIPHALQYLASCCSSSFNPKSYHSTVDLAMYILQEYQRRSGQNRISQITTSLELRQSVLSFPLKEFLEPHSTSCHNYWRLLEDFVTPFMQLLEAMVLNDPTSFYIRDDQLGILRTVIMQQIPKYFEDDRLVLFLVLFYHLGSNRFVPIIIPPTMPPSSYSVGTPPHMNRIAWSGDVLALFRYWPVYWRASTSGESIYHRFVRQLLRHDSGQIAEYVRGPAMHERAALACFGQLAENVPMLSSGFDWDLVEARFNEDFESIAHSINEAYDDDCFPLRYPSAIGEWHFLEAREYSDDGQIRLELYFLLLGYLIFLLPRCGRLDALMAACEEHMISTNDDDWHWQPEDGWFPVRRMLLREKIENYLTRVSPPLCVEPTSEDLLL